MKQNQMIGTSIRKITAGSKARIACHFSLVMAALLALASVNEGHAALFSISSLNTAFSENFDTLASSGSSSTLPTGWAISESGSSMTTVNGLYVASAGSATADTYSFGTGTSTERALGGLQSGSLVTIFGVGYQNNTGTAITGLIISYIGEQWRTGGNASRGTALDRLDFQYSTDATSLTTGSWLDYNALDFSSPVTPSATAGSLDGNAAANRAAVSSTLSGLSVANGASIYLRWSDFNVAGADDGLAVDNFSLTAVPEPAEWAAICAAGLLSLCGMRAWQRRNAALVPATIA